jgi:hypothetical protein
MIGATGLLGKIAEFLAQDLSKRKLARDSDKRGQACEAFTRLYYLLVDIEAITDYIRSGARDAAAQNRPDTIAFYIRDSLRRIKIASNDYIETFTMLNDPLEIYAPDLAEALRTVTGWKFNLLWEASKAYIVDSENNGATVVKMRYLKPDDRLLEIDIGSYVARVANGEARLRAEHFEWPEVLLYRGDIKSVFKDVELDFLSVEDVRHFSEMLDGHAKALSAGKLALREYIRATFSIEEVLYERKQIEPSWFG